LVSSSASTALNFDAFVFNWAYDVMFPIPVQPLPNEPAVD